MSQDSQFIHRHWPRRMIYRPKMDLQETTQETAQETTQETTQEPSQKPALPRLPEPEDPGTLVPDVQFPPWLENLVSVVHYNFPVGLVFFCVSCDKGLYQEKHFEELADQHGHDRLRMYDYEGLLCVNKADIESLGVDTAEIQEFAWSAPGADSAAFIVLHDTVGYAYADAAPDPRHNCSTCRCRLQFVRDWTTATTTKFCCLECKLRKFTRPRSVAKTRPSSPGLDSPDDQPTTPAPTPAQSPPPPSELHPTKLTYAQGIVSGGSSKPAHESDEDVKVRIETTDDGDDNDDLYDFLSNSFWDESKLALAMAQHDGLEVTDFEDEIASLFRSDLVFGTDGTSELAHIGVDHPGTPAADAVDTVVPTDRCLGDGEVVGNRAPEQAGSDSQGKNFEVVECFDERKSPADSPSSQEQSPTDHASSEVDLIGLPEVLFEDQLHVLLSPCEEILSSIIEMPTPPSSPTNLPDRSVSAKLQSGADCNPEEVIPDTKLEPEGSSHPTPASFRAALQAASSACNDQWWRDTSPATTSDGGLAVDGAVRRMENAELEGLCLPKPVDDNILRKAAFLLRSFDPTFDPAFDPTFDPTFDSDIESGHRDNADDEKDSVTSIQPATSPERSIPSKSPERQGLNCSIAHPEVESYKVQGSIDFRSLKQLAATFDPRRWVSEARAVQM